MIVSGIDDLKNDFFCVCESKHFQIKSPAEVIRVVCYEGQIDQESREFQKRRQLQNYKQVQTGQITRLHMRHAFR